MNLALRDIRHNALRFALTCLGLSGLLGTAVTMIGIYRGTTAEALSLPRADAADLWVVQPRTKGPFAEPSRIPRDTRDLVWRIPGVAAVGAITLQTVQATVRGLPVRLVLQGYEPGHLGGPPAVTAGHGITKSHYQIVVDASSGLRLGDEVALGPHRDRYTVVGLTQGVVTSSGDPVAWVTLLDAQDIQFAVSPPLQRREAAAGRSPLVTADINAVLVQLLPSANTAFVAKEINRWKHLAAVTEREEEGYLTKWVIERTRRTLGTFTAILVVVSAVILTLIIYTLTMDKLRSIATLKLVGAPDRTIVGLIVQEALILGATSFTLGATLTSIFKGYFARRVLIEPGDLAALFVVSIIVCLLASALSVRVALKVDPAAALTAG